MRRDDAVTFTPIDLKTWPRAQMFHYFSRMAPTGYSLTVPVDVTGLRAALKARGQKLFPTYLWPERTAGIHHRHAGRRPGDL